MICNEGKNKEFSLQAICRNQENLWESARNEKHARNTRGNATETSTKRLEDV